MTSSTSLQKTYLFTDYRHIRCSDLTWLSPQGDRLPVAGPQEPQVEAIAKTGSAPRGIRLVAQKAKKYEPLPRGVRRGSRVIFEDGLYRSWSLDVKYPQGKNLGAYSKDSPLAVEITYHESKDGFEWAEKARCPIEVPGQRSFDGFTFFTDEKGPPEERYKVVYMAVPPETDRTALWQVYSKLHPRYRDRRLREDHFGCIYAAVSPDGIDWKPVEKPLMVHWSDTDTTVYCDTWLDRYVMYTRLYPYERRTIGRAEAEDFDHWGPVTPLIWPNLQGSLSDDIYTNGRTEYPGVPGYHLMFPMVYHRWTQTSEIRLYSSADGICWNEAPGGPVITPGEVGEWDSEFIVAGKDLVPLGDDRIGIPYNGTSFPHKYPRWKGVLEASRWTWVWWQKGRLCAVVADEEGEFVTFPINPAGRELRLNLRTRRAGEVRVGLVGIPGRSLEDCDPICGNALSTPVHWGGEIDIGAKEGKSVALHFKLRAAELFGFEWS